MVASGFRSRWLALLLVGVVALGVGEAIGRPAPADRLHGSHIHQAMPVGLHAYRPDPLHEGVSPDPTGRTGAGGLAVAHRSGGTPIRSESVAAAAPKARMFP